MTPKRAFRRVAAFAAVSLCTLAGTASAATPRTISSSFELEATNGYSLEFDGVGGGHREAATVTLTRGNAIRMGAESSASYEVDPELVSPRRIRASFGAFGEVTVTFDPSGRTGGSRCRPFREGTFRGTIAFTGDNGFSEVNATSAEGNVTRPTRRPCLPGLGPVRGEARAEPPFPRLTLLESCMPALGFGYFAIDGLDDGAVHVAIAVERVGRIDIIRGVVAPAPARTFRFRKDLSAATVAPPPPFTGVGRYADGRLTGDLAVPVPGRDEPLGFAPARANLTDGDDFLASCEPIFLPGFARR